MSLGYACLTIGAVEGYRTCTAKNATEDKLRELIAHNLDILEQVMTYNDKHNIRLFRISSDIIPFGSSPVNTLDWRAEFLCKLEKIGEKAVKAGIRLSMHPGQYTVLNSPDPDVVKRAVEDLAYHTQFLDSLGLDKGAKMILHIGGAYGDKEQAIERFKANYQLLDAKIKNRLIIENDDRIYNIREVYEIGKEMGIPVVFDVLHHQVNPCEEELDVPGWIRRCAGTWQDGDGCPKIHYSQQELERKPGSHSETIRIREFLDFYEKISAEDIDVMLEVKDKNLSAVKCITAVSSRPQIKYLEQEWARYKYTVLERDPEIYRAIRGLLKDKSSYPAAEFYEMTEEALRTEIVPGHAVNAAQHVWGYFKDVCTGQEKESFGKGIDSYLQGKRSLKAVKSGLKRLAVKYERDYLLQSLYFQL